MDGKNFWYSEVTPTNVTDGVVEPAKEVEKPTQDTPTIVEVSDSTLNVTTTGEETNNTVLSLAGLASGSSLTVGSDSISLTGVNFGNGGVTVSSNSDNYKFYLSGTTPVSDKALFNGLASGANTITNAIANLSISGGTVNDEITNSGVGASIVGNSGADSIINTAAGVTIDAGEGNDKITNSGENVTFKYTSGSDTIEGFNIANSIVSLAGTASIAPTSFGDSISYDGTNYVVNLGTNNSLTFAGTNTFALKTGTTGAESIYTYTPGTIALSGTGTSSSIQGITLGGAYYSDASFNGTLEANSKFVSINAAAVNHTFKVTGNEEDNYMVGSNSYKTTLLGNEGDDYLKAGASGAFLNGGDDNDTLVGGEGNDTFAYTGGADSISGYGTGQDIVSVASGINIAGASIATADTNNLVLGFDSGDSLTFAGLANAETTVSLQSGRNTYLLKKDSFALGKSITLTSAFSENSFAGNETYNTINASAVTVDNGISITGNNNGNYIVGSATKANSLSSGTGNDTFKGGNAADVFFYAGGKDVIEGFGTADSLSITVDDIGKITKARASNTKLVFTKDKDNTITFKADGEVVVPSIVSVASGGYLTKDGYVSGNNFTLFGSAKGRIDLADDLYKTANITSVNASAVKKESVTLVGGTQGGGFTFAEKNKKRDVFEYGGGAVSISNYESGRDRINLGAASISGFEIKENDVLISLDSNANKTVSLKGAKGYEVLIHQDGVNKGNTYSKMAFTESGVIYDKEKNPTSATLWAGLTNDGFSAVDTNIKKITTNNNLSADTSITAGNKVNTIIDASEANHAVSLYGGTRNDKLIGSKNADMFVYTGGGKDVIQNFGAGADSISLVGASFDPLDANITSNRNFIKFKFDNKNMLTIKPTKGDTLNGSLNVNGEDLTYYKDAIVANGTASLTSKFGGTFKVKDYSGVATVNGSLSTNRLTLKGTTGAESLMGGTSKTTFKGGGGADSLVGGSGADIFFYAKGDSGTSTIQNFDFTKDSLKIANGTIKKVSVVGGKVQFDMKQGKSINDPAVGNFVIDSSNEKTLDENDSKKVLIKANNTYYWFANEAGTDVNEDPFKIGALITSDKKISSSKASGYQVIELNYATNLVKAGVAVAVKDANLPTKS